MFNILIDIYSDVWTENKSQAVIIFDASKSMWGQLDGVNKFKG